MIAYEKWSIDNTRGLPWDRFLWFLAWVCAEPAWSFKKLQRRLEANIFAPTKYFDLFQMHDEGRTHGKED